MMFIVCATYLHIEDSPMKNERQILLNLNALAVCICIAFVICLQIGHYPTFSIYFFAAALLYGRNVWLASRYKVTAAAINSIVISNILVLLFDTGYNSPVYGFMVYIPLMLLLFIIISYEKKSVSISLALFSALCLFITNFTELGGRLSIHLHTSSYLGLIKGINVSATMLLCIFITGGIIIANKRITNLLQIKKKLLEEKESTIAFLNNHVSEGLFRIAPNGVCVAANPAFASLFGYNPSEVINTSPFYLFFDKYTFNDILALLRMGDLVLSKEFELQRKDGSVFTGVVSLTQSNYNGNIYYEGIVKPLIPEKKKATIKEKSQFLSIISHEIRTPVNTIVGIGAHLIKKDLPEDVQLDVKLLNESSQTLIRVLDNILLYNNIEKGSLVLHNKPTDLKSLCHNVCNLSILTAQRKNISLQLDFDTTLTTPIISDAAKLALVLNNLVSNAIKFTMQGSVTVSIKKVTETENTVSVLFIIKDSGAGIPPKSLPYIFDAFSHLSNDITRQHDGMGLGLYVSKHILSLMHSHIEVDSSFGKGSSFQCFLTFEKSGNTYPVKVNYPTNLRGLRILLVEDNALNVLVAKRVFQDKNVTLDIAEDGFIALEKTLQNTYDIILMDLHMPGMDGFETTKAIRKTNKDVPIIAFSADVSDEAKEMTINAGMNDFITKPFDPERLFNKISKNL